MNMATRLSISDLDRAKQCSEWVSQYKNTMAQETSIVINKLIAEITILKHEADKDWKYACSLSNELDRRTEEYNNSYQCGEL